ncbi:MAG TPA: prolipoprotein diacylglyceryl transferase [Firmicutes bacterium]|jgi:phosphatidylglycerol:prolipoprotein diacylglycerol transferase|nr:prolipoprotein diacylglyceryl transferase [Bacillota bacterium]
MRDVLFSIGGINVYAYGTAVAVALLLGVIWVGRMTTQKKIVDFDHLLDLALPIVIWAIIGARLLYVLLELPIYLQDPISILYLPDGGLSFYGAVIGGFLAGYRHCKKSDLPLWRIADQVALYLPIGYAIARIGCLLHGCCYGVPTDLPWAMRCAAGDDLLRHPTQIYAIIASLFIFAVLWLYRKRPYFNGFLFWLYVELYVLTRFVIEIFRDSQILAFGWLRTTQVACLFIALAVLFYLRWAMKNRTEKVSNAPVHLDS